MLLLWFSRLQRVASFCCHSIMNHLRWGIRPSSIRRYNGEWIPSINQFFSPWISRFYTRKSCPIGWCCFLWWLCEKSPVIVSGNKDKTKCWNQHLDISQERLRPLQKKKMILSARLFPLARTNFESWKWLLKVCW